VGITATADRTDQRSLGEIFEEIAFEIELAFSEQCLSFLPIDVACASHDSDRDYFSKAKIRFQSFFMLIMTQPCFFASSYSDWVKVPTFVSGSPSAGP